MHQFVLVGGQWVPVRSDAMQAMNDACSTAGQVLRTDTSATPVKFSGGFIVNELSIVVNSTELAAQQTVNAASDLISPVINIQTNSVYKYNTTTSTWAIDATDSIANYLSPGLHYHNDTTGRLFFALDNTSLVYIGNRGVAAATDAEAIAGTRTDVAITSTQAKLAWTTWGV